MSTPLIQFKRLLYLLQRNAPTLIFEVAIASHFPVQRASYDFVYSVFLVAILLCVLCFWYFLQCNAPTLGAPQRNGPQTLVSHHMRASTA